MTTHATLSPSRAHRWTVCAGSIREESKYPDRTGRAAIDGTHSHTLLEQCIKQQRSPMTFIGQPMSDQAGEFFVEFERAERVLVAIRYIGQVVNQHNGCCVLLSESRVDPARLVGRNDMAGTVDVQILGGDTIEIIDYKDGRNPVDVVNNHQLLQYAVGVLAGLPDNHGYSKVKLTVIQPRVPEQIVSQVLDIEDVLRIIPDMVKAAAATDAPDARLTPGEHCKFCKAQGACQANVSNVMEKVEIMFNPVASSHADIVQQSVDKDPSAMTGEQLCNILEAAPMLRQLIEAVEAEAQRRLEAGQQVPGLKLVHGRGSRAWNLPEAEIAEKLVKMGIPKSAVYETKLVSPAKAEKLVWSKRDGTQMQLTDRQKSIMQSEYVAKMAGKLVVVHESDARQAVTMDAAPMFRAVIEAIPSWLS